MDSSFQIFGAKTTLDIRSGFLGIVTGPETILPDMSGGPTDFRGDCQGGHSELEEVAAFSLGVILIHAIPHTVR